MSSLNGLSIYLRKPIFENLFQLAEYSKLKLEEREMYNASLRNKWDAESIRSSQEELLKRGREKAIKNLLSSNKFSISEIAELANVTVEFVKQIEAEKSKGK